MSVIAKNIVKSFNDIEALRYVSFEIEPGMLFGFIGPDGAGKTTLFRILTTLLLQDEGEATVLGYDVISDYRHLRKQIGYMPGRFSLYQDLTVEENMRFFAAIFNTTVNDNYHLVYDIFHSLEPFKKRRAGNLSGGMKQKLALSCALIHKPRILILDEPTTGVDAVSRREFWGMLAKLRKSGLTILVSTPYMDEASRCDQVALMHKGEILGINTPDGISKKFDRNLYAIRANNNYLLLNTLRNYEHVHTAFIFGEYIHYTDQRDHLKPDELDLYLKQKGYGGVEIKEIKPGVEDTLISLMTPASYRRDEIHRNNNQ